MKATVLLMSVDIFFQEQMSSVSSQTSPATMRKMPVRILQHSKSFSQMSATKSADLTKRSHSAGLTWSQNDPPDGSSDERVKSHTHDFDKMDVSREIERPSAFQAVKSGILLMKQSHSSPNLCHHDIQANSDGRQRNNEGVRSVKLEKDLHLSYQNKLGKPENDEMFLNSNKDKINIEENLNNSISARSNSGSVNGYLEESHEEKAGYPPLEMDSSINKESVAIPSQLRMDSPDYSVTDESPSQGMERMFVNLSHEGAVCSAHDLDEVEKIAPPYPPLQLCSSSFPNYSESANFTRNFTNNDRFQPQGFSAYNSSRGSRSDFQSTQHFFLESVEEDSVMVTDASQNALLTSRSSCEGEKDHRSLQLSSSVVDVVCIIQRLIGFVETLSKTLYPILPTGIAPSQCDTDFIKNSVTQDSICLKEAINGREQIYEKALQVICYLLPLKGLYHRRVFAVCLQSDLESYEWGLSARSVDLK